MQKLVKEYLSEWKKQQKKRRRIGIAVMLLIVMVVSCVIGSLTQYGVALTGDPKCGMEEHQHNDSCYTSVLTCGQEESEGHQHNDSCYTTTSELTCGQEEGEEHQHDDSCYTETSELTCGQEESDGHTHTDECYTEELACGMKEHTHTDECYIDTDADVEDAAVWNDQYKDVEWKETWSENLVIAAQMQIGYKESSDNYIVSENGSHKGYTRYGQFATNAEMNAEDNPEGNTAGDAYRDWDAAFVNFCIYYAGLTNIDPKVFPEDLKAADTTTWCEEFGKVREENGNYLAAPNDHTPAPGDIVFSVRENEETEGQMGIVSSYNKETNEIKVIEGNSGNEVRENTYDANDEDIVSYLMMAEIEKDYKADEDDAANEEETLKQDEVKTPEETEKEDEGAIDSSDAAAQETPVESTGNTVEEDTKKTEESNEKGENQEQSSEERTVTEESDYSIGQSLEDLEKIPEDEVGAAVWQTVAVSGSRMRRASARSLWSYDAYYVNQDNRYNITKTNDFNLKYQMEFHTSQTFYKNAISIRVERALLQERNKSNVNPAQIAVLPVGEDGKPVESKGMPFNYRIVKENGKEYLEFFNYKEIAAGTNVAWQILYKNLQIMHIEDETRWTLEPKITIRNVDKDGNLIENETEIIEERTTDKMTGLIDSSVELTRLTKIEYKAYDKLYTPGLYTADQVKAYTDYISPANKEKYFTKDSNGTEILSSEYRFVVWEVTMKGKANQPWTIRIEENVGNNGEVVGYKDNSNVTQGYDTPISPEDALNKGIAVNTQYEKKSWSSRFFVVTAYPKEDAPEGKELDNTVTITSEPYDGKDDPTSETVTKTMSANWNYKEYKWSYNGDIIGMEKKNGNDDNNAYKGWLEVYSKLSTKGEDYGDIPFISTGKFRGYQYTHNIEGTEIGQYKQDTKYKLITADDVMYVRVGNEDMMLTDDDYYYTSVSVTQRDIGYDIWEDASTAIPENNDNEGTMIVYAMFENETQWERVAEVPWDSSGEMKYTFNSDDLKNKPWRVKVEHVTTNYRTTCQINVRVCVKASSNVMKDIMKKYNDADDALNSIKFEDISGVIGQYWDQEEKQWKLVLVDKETGEENGTTIEGGNNYSEPGLKEKTKEIYLDLLGKFEEDDTREFPMYRDNVYKEVTGLEKRAKSYKRMINSSNDVYNQRGLMTYSLTAHDGYQIFSEDAVNELKRNGVASPGRKNVVFYDLLPYGVNFDPSYQIRAGRIKSLDQYLNYTRQPGTWDASQVDVSWETKENYKGTGRTMVILHISYEGEDAAVYSSKNWMEGWGVSFGAYYDWKDSDIVQNGTNISAFMPDTMDPAYGTSLIGTDNEVACDDGVVVPTDDPAIDVKECEVFGANIDGNSDNDNVRNVLYASNSDVDEVAQYFDSRITKQVKADEDKYTSYRGSAVVEEKGRYTYDITVTTNTELSNIIVYDHLENAKADLADDSIPDQTWHGTLQSVITSGLESMGVDPVVYFSKDRNARSLTPEEIGEEKKLNSIKNDNKEQVWYTQDELESQKIAMEQIQSVAVDMRKSSNPEEGDYVLHEGMALSFRIKMQAPAANGIEEDNYAYNRPFYSSTGDTGEIRWGEYTKVRIKEASDLAIVKKLGDNVPDAVKDSAFEFQLFDEESGEPFAYQEYKLYKKEAAQTDGWVEQPGRYATNGDGILDLHADEKIVFEKIPDVERIWVQENHTVFWEPEETDTPATEENNYVRTVTVENTYRPVLYVQKNTSGKPEDIWFNDENRPGFRFLIESGEGDTLSPLAEAEYYYVDSVRTDGGIPQIIGEGRTDEKGELIIHENEIIALFPGDIGTSYKVTELKNDSSENWICRNDFVQGTVPLYGASATIQNIYRWKDLYLTKEITHRDPVDCEEDFTFKLEKVKQGESGEEIENLTQEEIERIQLHMAGRNSYGKYIYLEETVTPVIAADGTFTFKIKAEYIRQGINMIRVRGLEAETTYKITEVVDEESKYRPDNDSVEVTAPSIGSEKEITITNDYQLRSLTVSKEVVGGSEDSGADDREFTMTVRVNGNPLDNFLYILTEDGQVVGDGSFSGTPEHKTDSEGKFTLKSGQTAIFEDAGWLGDNFEVEEAKTDGYLQISPADEKPWTGIFSGEGTECKFINADQNDGKCLYISKRYEPSQGLMMGIAQNFIDQIQDRYGLNSAYDEYSVEATLKVNKKEIEGEIPVLVVDQLNGKVENGVWIGSTYTLKPWCMVIIKEEDIRKLPGVNEQDQITYTLSESVEDQHRIANENVMGENRWFEISQKDTGISGGVIEGSIDKNPMAVITNEVKSLTLRDEIRKVMTDDSSEVEEGQELFWRVERYNGVAWQPAAGVSYITVEGAWKYSSQQNNVVPTCDKVLMTGEDGMIKLVKSDNPEKWPAVYFVNNDQNVLLNMYERPNIGTLRVVEVMENSDDGWGMLTGYSGIYNPNQGLAIGTQYSGSFINSNKKIPVEIAKEMTEKSEDTFTMILKQVLSLAPGTDSNAIQKQDILTAEGREGIPYTVYDKETGETQSRKTGKNGEIELKKGQYARLELPTGTLWTVSEELDYSKYELKDLRPEKTDRLTKLSDNLMLINQGNVSAEKVEWCMVSYHNHEIVAATNSTLRGNVHTVREYNKETFNEPPNGYEFYGWSYIQHEIGNGSPDIYPGDQIQVTGNLDLYPVFREAKVKLIYKDRGLDYCTEEYIKGSTVIIKNCTNTREEYEFIGWNTDPNATTPDWNVKDKMVLNADSTLYAVWKKRDEVSIKYNFPKKPYSLSNETYGKYGCEETIKDCTTIFKEALQEKEEEGYRFVGWSTKINATEVEYEPGDVVTLDGKLELYPVFEKISQ